MDTMLTPSIGIHATRPSTFVELCDYLASNGGGFTLWIGAGASIASSGGRTPSWSTLAEDLAAEVEKARNLPRPPTWATTDFPNKLEWISEQLSHALFRRTLRERLVMPLATAPLEIEVCLDQATIGARASTVVSFNIELASALPFGAGTGGAFIARPYLPPSEYVAANVRASAGGVGRPVYFPHGLLDTQGNCVMTRSEYDRFGASLAASTAVNLCLGGDLLVLGMSLADSYLRAAILRGRQWIRNIYWVNEEFPFAEWARVAQVTCIHAEHALVWAGIAKATLEADSDGHLLKARQQFRGLIPTAAATLSKHILNMQQYMNAVASRATRIAEADAGYLETVAEHCINLGLDIPEALLTDPRWRRGRH